MRGAAMLEAEGSERAGELRKIAALYAVIGEALPTLIAQWREQSDG